MKLTYRGVEYDYNPPMLEVTESDTLCQYRGQTRHYTYVRHVPIPQPAERLSYRGVAYQTTRQGAVQPIDELARTQSRPAVSLGSLRQKLTGSSPEAQARRALLQESSRHHRENISRSLQHRIDVARQQGNEALLAQLELEQRQSV